jgi:hypothetical protein
MLWPKNVEIRNTVRAEKPKQGITQFSKIMSIIFESTNLKIQISEVNNV